MYNSLLQELGNKFNHFLLSFLDFKTGMLSRLRRPRGYVNTIPIIQKCVSKDMVGTQLFCPTLRTCSVRGYTCFLNSISGSAVVGFLDQY